jgi:archaellum biogenesis ATPase FlaH
MKKPPVQIVLSALRAGQPIKLGQYTYMMGQTPEGKDVLCFRMWKEPGQEEVLVACDMTVNDFLRECEKLTEEELFAIGCEKVLTQINRKSR